MPPKVLDRKPSDVASLLNKTREPEVEVDEPDVAEQQTVLELMTERLEVIDERMKSLKEPFDRIQTRFTEHDSRLQAVEEVALKLDVGTAPAVAAVLYKGLKPENIFIAALVGIVQTLISTYPQVMLSGKPANRKRQLVDAVAIAQEVTALALEQLPAAAAD